MEKKLQKIYSTDYNLLIAQNLWQTHYQIWSRTFLEEFLKLNVNMDTMIKKGKLVELLNNAVFGKIIENVSKHTDIKLVTTGK